MSVLNPFLELFARLMAAIYAVVPSYGFAIIALTLIVMVVLTPLTLKGTRSMMMMQQLQPEMKKLQSKYKDDRQQLNEELMKFYKENNINPLGGCLPLLVQMPVFIVLYNVLKGLTLRAPLTNAGWATGQTMLAQAPTLQPPVNFQPLYLPTDSKMYISLSQTNTMAFAGMDLAESCSDAIRQGWLHALPYVLLIIVVGISGFVQQRQIQGRTPNAQVNPQQQQIMKIMPIFLPVISFGLPAGLVLYFAVSNLYRIGQQWFISRSIYGIKRGDKPEPVAVGAGKGGAAKGGSAKGATSSGKSSAKAKAIDTTEVDAEPKGFRARAAAALGGAATSTEANGNGGSSSTSKTTKSSSFAV
jgi:YidC/Oxa1 family membrane protein insertase